MECHKELKYYNMRISQEEQVRKCKHNTTVLAPSHFRVPQVTSESWRVSDVCACAVSDTRPAVQCLFQWGFSTLR
jgi:hypothetical protein